MEFLVLPQVLAMFYGAVILGCGGTLGFVFGRNWRSRRGGSTPPEDHERRLMSVEDELDLARRELQQLLDERDFMRELKSPTPERIRRDCRLVA